MAKPRQVAPDAVLPPAPRAARPANPVSRFIRAAYGSALPARALRRRTWRLRYLHLGGWNSPLTWSTACWALSSGILLWIGIYCYNDLVEKLIDIEAGRSRVAVLMQRRNDLYRSVETALRAERAHEASIFSEAANNPLRQKKTPPPLPAAGNQPPDAASTGALAGLSLEGLLAVAEQYPSIRLSENVQSLIAAAVEVEKDLGQTRQKLVDVTNIYLHQIHTVPGRWFAWMFGFDDVSFFQASNEAGRFVPIKL
jgi:LemA protein